MEKEKDFHTSKFKAIKNIGIVGLGLIGGSLALDLQRIGYTVHGVTHRKESAREAEKKKIAQVISTDTSILKKCSLIILALPLEKILNPEQQLINALPNNAVITDVGSVKEPVLKIWNKIHPHFVGSHPMAGTNESGIHAGKRDLFKNKAWISTPSANTNSNALKVIEQLAISLGSQWVIADAKLHDNAVALVSHLPVLVSGALLQTVSNEKNHELLNLSKTLASSGFSDTTRVGGGNPYLGVSMARNNKTTILKNLKSYRNCIKEIEDAIISEQWSKLQQILEENQKFRPEFL